MKKTQITLEPNEIPEEFHALLRGSTVYDSSSSPNARVLFFDKDGGYYLKSAAKGSLATEAAMASFFAQKGLGAEMLSYQTGEKDWLLTARVMGEDATHACYLSEPVRLAETLAYTLRALHEVDFTGCPVKDHAAFYLTLAERNYHAGVFDRSGLPDDMTLQTATEVWRVIEERRHLLQCEVLLHGDYCLPNVVFADWKFSGFVDLGNGGVGDRHVDLYWGIWSLAYNLKTAHYGDLFLDAYGRDKIDYDRLSLIAAIESFG